MKWLEHEFEIDRDTAQGVGFEFWRKRAGVTATSMTANMFGRDPGGWLAAKGTPTGLRALANEAFVGLFELLRLERAIAAHQGKPTKLIVRDRDSSYWYPVRVAVGGDYDSDGSYAPSDYAVSADDQVVAIRYEETVIFTKDDDIVEVHTFGGYPDDDGRAALRGARDLFDALVTWHSLEPKLEEEWGTAYQTDPDDQARIDHAVAAIRARRS